jgi:hypothetical protein
MFETRPSRVAAYSLFKDDPAKFQCGIVDDDSSEEAGRNKKKKVTLTERYTTHYDESTCDIYEGNIQAFTELEEVAKKIRQSLLTYVIGKDEEFEYLVLDFL